MIKKIQKEYKNLIIYSAKAGFSRQESSLNGLKKLKSLKLNLKKVLIHDASRPFIKNKIINKLILNLNKFDGCAPLIQNVDLSRIAKNNKFIEFKSKIFSTQTPQGFIFKKILKANMNQINKNARDDIELINNNFLLAGCQY